MTPKEFNKAFKSLVYEGLIYEGPYFFVAAVKDSFTVDRLHKNQIRLEFKRDRDRFIKKHGSNIPEHLLMQLKSI
jgi:hypothetical protein